MNSIRRIRIGAGLSQAQLAAELGVGQSAVSQYETGAIRPGIDQARRLVALAAKAGLRISLDQVYERQPPVHAPPIREFPHA
ncbi:XRE family transcriptional regulator [Bordetella avium]|uniref:helix-turn-helix transcriptional regulator n=1 Tax=Bordetella avium TaxID=521 RepID=UPI000FD7DA4B|nr:XRE family transcriptional regulator [Bordetella avium]